MEAESSPIRYGSYAQGLVEHEDRAPGLHLAQLKKRGTRLA